MPIAAKLSRKFYETLGDEAAETMIDWMHGVDAHRTELRELYELSFDRYDARLGERFAEFRNEIRIEFSTAIGMLRDELRTELRTETQSLRTETQSVRTETQSLRKDLVDVRADIAKVEARIEARIEARFADVIKWSFTFWVGSVITMVLGMAAMARLGR